MWQRDRQSHKSLTQYKGGHFFSWWNLLPPYLLLLCRDNCATQKWPWCPVSIWVPEERFTSKLSVMIGFQITHSKSKTIITRSMCVIILIVFTDKYQGHVWTSYIKWFFITFKLYPNTTFVRMKKEQLLISGLDVFLAGQKCPCLHANS